MKIDTHIFMLDHQQEVSEFSHLLGKNYKIKLALIMIQDQGHGIHQLSQGPKILYYSLMYQIL